MELWIRSQDKRKLVKVDVLMSSCSSIIANDNYNLGIYKTRERALEVLDEIQNKIHQTFICELKCLVSEEDYKRIKSGLEVEYSNNEFIMQPQHYELKPINSNVVIYEMPEE